MTFLVQQAAQQAAACKGQLQVQLIDAPHELQVRP